MTSRPRFLPAALCGVLALVAALAAGHLAASFGNVNASPYLAAGNGAIDLTPLPVKDFAVRTFGTYDKAVLLGGMAVVPRLVSAAAGVLSPRTPWPGLAVIVAFGLIGGVAVAARPDLTSIALLAPLASLLVGAAVFLLLHRIAARQQATDSSRRSFLLGSVGTVAGAGVLGGAGK